MTSTSGARAAGSTSNACQVPSPTVGIASLVRGIGRVFMAAACGVRGGWGGCGGCVGIGVGLGGAAGDGAGPRANAGASSAGAQATIPEVVAIRRTSRREGGAIAQP